MTGPARRELAFVLLLIQAGIALLTAGGEVFLEVVAPGFRGIRILAALELLVAVGLLLLAAGVIRNRPGALRWTVYAESPVLLGSFLTLFLRLGISPTLAFIVAQVLLPLAITTLVAMECRPAFSARAQRPREVTSDPVVTFKRGL